MTTRNSTTTLLPFLLAGVCGIGHAGTVRFRDAGPSVSDRTIDGTYLARAAPVLHESIPFRQTPAAVTGTPVCGLSAVDWQGQPLPDGESGTLNPIAFQHSVTINNNGRIAFAANVDGAARDQGMFVADAGGLHIIALGCGGGGGSGAPDSCGDPSPLGGTFSGFFLDTFATPAINDNGDVLFIADIDGGSAPRGLFLYRESDASIVTVAAVGDTSPLGGTLTTLGGGSLDNADTVAFVAVTDAASEADILLWQGGVLSKYVAAGDPAPEGGTFNALGTELWGYADGSFLSGGPTPGINESGQIAFRGYVSNGSSAGGLFLSTNGKHEWLVKAGDTAPGGGTYADFAAPLLNDQGEIAFFADLAGNPATQNAWFAGSPDHWRRALASADVVEGGTVDSLAYSRNPMRALADNGDLVLWASRLMPDQSDRGTALVSHPDGDIDILAVQGDASPIGGFWGGSMNGWPVINDVNQIGTGSATPGFGDALSADVVFTLCAGDVVFRDGFDG